MEDKDDKEESATLPARDFALQLPSALLLVEDFCGNVHGKGRRVVQILDAELNSSTTLAGRSDFV